MFFIPRDNWKAFFSIQTYRYPEVWCNCHIAALLKQLFWKKSIFYIHFLRNNITMLLIPQGSKMQNKASTS